MKEDGSEHFLHFIILRPLPASDFTVVLGVRTIFTGQVFRIGQLLFHPSFTKTLNYDLALIRLSMPVRFSPTIRPICLPSREVPSFVTGVTAGKEKLQKRESRLGTTAPRRSGS